MKKRFLTILLAAVAALSVQAQRYSYDKLDRGLVAQKVSSGVFLSWRILGEEYYDVQYNVYRDGEKITETPLEVSNFLDTEGSTSSKYSIAPVIRGKEAAKGKEVTPWSKSYMEIIPQHDASLKSTYVPNDACCCDVDGDGELEILLKYDNADEIGQSFPKNGPVINGKNTKEYSLLECLKLDGTVLWWINCGPNMGDFQNNEINIVGYDWDGDGKAEVVLRAADGTTIHKADGTVYTVGNANLNYRADYGGGVNWFMCQGAEYLLYLNGETGNPYQCITYPLARLESGETDLNSAWGDGTGHRSSKYFFGAPYLDGRKPSIFLARGIYTRHKMIAYDVDPATHKLVQRWKWYNNTNGPWKGQGYHNYSIADVDMDGRDEIVFGSMTIDDNGKGLSTTGYGHGDAHHVGDFNPYVKGLEFFACNEDRQGFNYKDATTSKVYAQTLDVGSDIGRGIAGNFSDSYPGCIGVAYGDPISTVKNTPVSGISGTGINSNFRIYWDGDLLEETFNYVNGKNTEGCVAKYGSWSPIYTCEGSMTNNDTKGTPCYQGDIFGDWREEIIMRTANNRIRIYSTPTSTKYRNYTLWHDHQYRNAMVWQMCGYNQPPHVSYFLGSLEKITVAPPPLTMNEREEVKDGGTIGSAQKDQHVIVCETGNSNVTIEKDATPYILTFNVPSWVQGSAGSESTASSPKITYTTYTCNVTGGGIAGTARLIKQGDGILNLPKADFTHSGETNIWGGTLNFDGKMANSPLWLNRFAELNSNGGEFKSITADYASVIRPGGEGTVGNIVVDEALTLNFGSRIVIDINGDTNDCIKAKTLAIEKKTGTAWTKGGPEYLQPVLEIAGNDIKAGDYVIAEAESVEGNVTNLKIEGNIGVFKTGIKYENGKVILSLGNTRGASNIIWTGANSAMWDFATTENFILDNESATPDVFVAGDAVEFNDNATNVLVNVTTDLAPGGVFVNNDTKAYTFLGNGSWTSGSFTKEGKGTATINTTNSYKGGNYLKGGTVKIKSLSNSVTAKGSLGGVTTSPTQFTMENGATLQPTAAVINGSPIKMIGEEGGVINSNDDFTQEKTFSGTVLTKKGTGCLHTQVANSLSRLVLVAGSVACKGNPASTVELQGGTLWDDAQSTTHGIYVPKGKSATWQLSNVYYTAYANKITGEGTLTIVPRNTVSRVRITGNWSEFKGTIKHTNTNIWLPLDMSTGMPHGTLDIAEGCGVTNVTKTMIFGAVTGKGSLNHAISNFQSQAAVSGTNTWKIGNSDDKNFTFNGIIHDDGGTNKSNFEKIGTCKMTTSGVWDNTGTTKITAGELHFNSGSLLGKGALTVASGATLSGITKSGTPLTNSSFTINGTLQPGTTATAVAGSINFNGKNVTFGATSTLVLGMRVATTGLTPQQAYITNIGTLRFLSGATIAPFISSSYVPTQDESKEDLFYLWTEATTVSGVDGINLVLPELPAGNYWDTRSIAEGKLYVRYNAALSVQTINANEAVSVEVVSASGAVVDKFNCQMSAVKATFAKKSLSKGIYMLRIKSESNKQNTLKMVK